MPIATVTVKFVNPAAQGKKEGSIKVQDDSFYGVPPAMLSQFQPGGTYELDYTSREWQGKTYKSVKSAKSIAAPPATGSGGSGYAQSNKDTQLHIFVCGALNHAIGAGQLNILDEGNLLLAVETLKRVWRQAFSGEPRKQTTSEEMGNEQIPF